MLTVEIDPVRVVAALHSEKTDGCVREREGKQKNGKHTKGLFMVARRAVEVVETIDGRSFAKQGKERRQRTFPAWNGGQEQPDVIEAEQRKEQILESDDIAAISCNLKTGRSCLEFFRFLIARRWSFSILPMPLKKLFI